MSSNTSSIPSDEPASRLRSSVSSAESVSGMSRPTTRSGSNARQHSAAVTLESIPPERPITAPRLPSSRYTTSRSRSAICSTDASASRRRAPGASATSDGDIAAPRLPRTDVPDDVGDRVEVLRRDVVDRDLQPEPSLEEAHDLEHSGRVDHAELDQGAVGGHRGLIAGQGEVVLEEPADLSLDRLLVHQPLPRASVRIELVIAGEPPGRA